MSTRHPPAITQPPVALKNAQSVIATKPSELHVLWEEICTRDPSSSTEGRTSRLNKLIKDLQSVQRKHPPTYINNLPSELLCLIFAFTVSPDLVEEKTFIKPRSTSWGSLALTMVCKRWQAIMLSSPWLWGNLIIDRESFEPEHLGLHLHLSHGHPLTLYLITPSREALLALRPHAHRIQHLYCRHFKWYLEILHGGTTMILNHPWVDSRHSAGLYIPTSIVTLVATLHSPLEPIFHLRNLQCLIISDEEGNLSLMPEQVEMPRLRLLDLNHIASEDPTGVLKRFPVQRLQTLRLVFPEDMSYKNFTSLQTYIYQMPSLISVKITMRPLNLGWIERPPPPESFSSTIKQVELKRLGGGMTPFQFVAGIRSLEKLTLTLEYHDGEDPRVNLKGCLHATLRELEITLRWEDVRAVQEITLPYLETLVLNVDPYLGSSLLRNLSAPSLIRLEIPPRFIPASLDKYTSAFKSAIFIHSHQLGCLNIGSFELGSSDTLPAFPRLRTLRVRTRDWKFLISLDAPHISELMVFMMRVLREGDYRSGK